MEILRVLIISLEDEEKNLVKKLQIDIEEEGESWASGRGFKKGKISLKKKQFPIARNEKGWIIDIMDISIAKYDSQIKVEDMSDFFEGLEGYKYICIVINKKCLELFEKYKKVVRKIVEDLPVITVYNCEPRTESFGERIISLEETNLLGYLSTFDASKDMALGMNRFIDKEKLTEKVLEIALIAMRK